MLEKIYTMLISVMADIIFFTISLLAFHRILRFYTSSPPNTNHVETEKNYKISVIIPCRNEEKRLPNLLESLKKQTYKNFEVIVVDDGSVDKTVEVARNYGAKVVVRKDIFGDWEGKSAACYAGVLNSSGDIILFLDADVFLEERALEYLVKNFNDNAVISCQPYHYIERLYENLSLIPNLITTIALGVKNGKNRKPGLYGPCIMISKDLYLNTGGHKLVANSIVEDIDLGIKLSKMGIPINIITHNNLIKFRMYPEGIKYLFDGWSKNMVLGALRANIKDIIVITSIIISSMSSFGSVIRSIIQKEIFLVFLYAFLYFLFGIFVFITSRKIGKFSPLLILFHQIITLFFIIIFIRSILLKITGATIYWRGRKIKL